MKSLYTVILLLFCYTVSYAQEHRVSGRVVDINNAPIEYATITLYNADQSALLNGTFSNSKGTFSLTNLKPDTYILKVRFIGYRDFEKTVVVAKDMSLDSIRLEEDIESLNEVTVTSKKPTLKREADRLIFNIENTALTEGNMLQVLQNTPGVLVLGDEILVKNSNPTVYINNRKVHLSPDDLSQLLEGSSANSIKSIEVITNPSARYDAESGVVLNIVMSKNLITGYRGAINSTFTQAVFPRYGIGTNHFFKNEDISFNINYNYSKDKINRNGDDTVNFLDSQNDLEESWRSFTNRNTWSETHSLNANFDYFINDKNTLSLSTSSLYLPYFKYKIKNNTTINDDNDEFLSRFTADNLSRDNKYNLGFDLDFSHTLDKGTITFNTHYTTYNYDRNQTVLSDFFNENNNFIGSSAFNTEANQNTQILAAKIDYSLPITEDSNFEVGLKFSAIATESDVSQFDVDLATGTETLDALNSDVFDYDERVFAGFVNYAKTTESYNFSVGLRAEQTNVDGQSPLTNITNTQDYFELFPNASFQYNIYEGYSIYANYKRSIARPGYADLNPFRFFLNENYVVAGNPNLVPSFLDHYVIGATLFDFVTVEAYYQNYDGAISEIPRQNNETNIIEFTSVNFDKTVEFGFDLIMYYSFIENWDTSFVTSFYNIEEETNFGNGFVTQSQWSNYSELYNSVSLLKDKSLNVSLSLTWLGKNLQAFQTVEDRLFSQLAISKSVLNKQGSITLSVSDIFNQHDFSVSTQYQNQFSSQFVDIDDRYVRLGFRYKFGNTRLETNQRSTNLDERDRLNKASN
ncbi:MAG: outer membrane beta-barrel family protein [Psychroserpens sp.]|uniref:TonB-dependent receptor domain-containing protein n=1 Tax=Psychroserpens sp. TaxID=2020870 RepID=UPI003CA78F5E